MRYLVKAKLKRNQKANLLSALRDGTLGQGSVAGDEYQRNMNNARIDEDGTVSWIEVCFCDVPLSEERPYWEEYFELISITDAHSRRNCEHENGSEPWACTGCDCTEKLEARLHTTGSLFLDQLNN